MWNLDSYFMSQLPCCIFKAKHYEVKMLWTLNWILRMVTKYCTEPNEAADSSISLLMQARNANFSLYARIWLFVCTLTKVEIVYITFY